MSNQVVRILHAMCEEAGTPRALAVSLLARAGEWAQLQQLRVSPHSYRSRETYYVDALVTELLRKCDLPSGVDTEAAAKQTFWRCEAQNARTNARLERFVHGGPYEPEDLPVVDFICRWRKEIADVLGSLPLSLTPRFSSGATYADTGKLTTIPDKMSSTPTLYQGSVDVIMPFWTETSWYRSLRARNRGRARVVRGNIFFSVPKDGLTRRGACKEASLAVGYQLDAGLAIRGRLRRIGITIKTGKETHMARAREASQTGADATVDMSNASDLIPRSLPRLVLPDGWHTLLDSLRATHTRIDGRWVRLEKFSSMGNGFTFELETLLFATLARVLVRETGGNPDLVTVFGDDVILPSDVAEAFLSALRMFGSTPNMKKTFTEGPFRESCGGDYWDGTPVRAAYLEELPDEPHKWIALANTLRRLAPGSCSITDRRGVVYHPARVIRAGWLAALRELPIAIRACRGPVHLGDLVVHDDESRWQVRSRVQDQAITTHEVKAWVPVPLLLGWEHWHQEVQFAACTLQPSRGVTPRKSGEEVVAGYRYQWLEARLRNYWLPSA